MGKISLRLTEKEARLLRRYAKRRNTDISSIVQQALTQKIEEDSTLGFSKKVWAKKRAGEKSTLKN